MALLRRSYVLLLSVGCSFDLSAVSRPGGDAAAVDAPVDAMMPVDGGPCTPAAPVQTGVMQDTVILSTQPMMSFGSLPVLNVGVTGGGIGLYKFNLSAVPTTARIQSVQVTFPFAQSSNQCSPSCGSCTPLEQPGDLSMFFMRSDWSDTTTNWDFRDSGLFWGSPGASGSGIDRDATPATAMSHARSASPMLIVTGAALDGVARWRTIDNLLSVQLVPSNGAVFICSARESANEACATGGWGAAKMTITYCP
jgi:hypothetical protein